RRKNLPVGRDVHEQPNPQFSFAHLQQSCVEFEREVNLEFADHRMQALQLCHNGRDDFGLLATEFERLSSEGFILWKFLRQNISQSGRQQGKMVCDLESLCCPKWLGGRCHFRQPIRNTVSPRNEPLVAERLTRGLQQL